MIDENKNPVAISLIANYIAQRYPDVYTANYEKEIKSCGKRMSAVQTAAMIADAGISKRTALIKIQKHLKHHLGYRPFCVDNELTKLTSDRPAPEIRKFKTNGKSRIEKKETVYTREHDICGMLRMKTSKWLAPKLASYKLRMNQMKTSLFSYRTASHKRAVYVLLGTDHGQGACTSMIRVLYGCPKKRKKSRSNSDGTLSFSFSTIKCKTDSSEILSLTKDGVGRAIDTLAKSQLVAVKDEFGKISTYFIDHDAVSMWVKNQKLNVRKINGSVQKINISSDLTGILKCFVIAPRFHILMVGDLSAQMCLQGRSGMSSSRCTKCKTTWSQWNRSENDTDHRLLKLDDLMSGTDTDIGLTSLPIWNICPSDCVVPILHCQLGTVNYQIFERIWPYLLSLDCSTEEEVDSRRQWARLNSRIRDLQEEYSMSSVLTKERIAQIKIDRSRLTEEKKRLKTQLKYASRVNNPVDEINESIITIQNAISEKDSLKSSLNSRLARLKSRIKTSKSELRGLKKKIGEFVKQRKRKEMSIDTKAERVLIDHGVNIDAYHGGTLVGQSILKLFTHIDSIFDRLISLGKDRILQRTEEDNELPIPSLSEFEKVMAKHKKLLVMQNSVYASLRIISPSILELDEAKTNIEAMKSLWSTLGFSLTPKAHLVFAHAYFDMVRLGGLGDKTEDFIEKRHQDQKRYNNITMRQHHVTNQLKSQDMMEWRDDDPVVRQQIAEVDRVSTRISTDAKRASTEKSNIRKRERVVHRYRVAKQVKWEVTRLQG